MTPASTADAVLRTLAYADVFDFALTDRELHRYLIGQPATPADIREATTALGARVVRRDELTVLADRDGLIDQRHARRSISRRTWPTAVRYARAVGALPFVRMVAITGALAVGNATEGADIDLLVVSTSGRVWTARAGAILLVRFAARAGHDLCPNYILSAHTLTMDPQDLYRAHELAQMVPVVGTGLYARLRAANDWAARHLPNAPDRPSAPTTPARVPLRRARPFAEASLRTPFGTALERLEQRRKIPRFRAEARARGVEGEAGFTADWCKGHLDGHGARIRAAYELRAGSLGVEPLW